MAPPPGTRADSTEPAGAPAAIGRFAVFALLAGTALVLVTAVVLLPAHERLAWAEYERDCLAAKNADDAALILANERLIAAAPDDPVLTKRLAMRQFGVLPRGEAIIPVDASPAPFGRRLTAVAPHPRPPKPAGWMIYSAARVRDPVTRTILLLLAVVLFLAAVILSDRPQKKRSPAAV